MQEHQISFPHIQWRFKLLEPPTWIDGFTLEQSAFKWKSSCPEFLLLSYDATMSPNCRYTWPRLFYYSRTVTLIIRSSTVQRYFRTITQILHHENEMQKAIEK